ncbi:MAG TPA: response regulator [Steroidobacteraceae bacterium]|nr:response regulator [Steroidobacteraceae bacterium]
MKRFETATHPVIYWLIGLFMAAVFVIDVRTPIGVATWLLYLLPILMCFLAPKPWLPVLLAAVASGLMVADWFLSPRGAAAADIAQVNRGMGLICIWTTAMLARNTLITRLRLRQQEWLRAARVQLAETMVGEQSLARMAQRVLEFLTNYLNAQAGAMYVAEPSGVYSRVGVIGVDPSAATPDAVRAGEGLLGRAITERKPQRIDNLPADYLRIGSGLGSRGPHALLVAPLVVEDTTHGVIELGFLHPTFDSDIEMLASIGESVAIAIRTGMLRRERENLLKETQRQAEELQAQQEELRVANEELLSQSAQLRDSQARLETQQAELEQTNVQLEEHAQKLGKQHDELIETKLDLERKAADLARANRYKSEFLANMSHELRTPLNSSLILAKLLADNKGGNLTPEQVKYARGITSAGNDLLALINDILDLSKIEARKVEITRTSVNLAELALRLSETFEPIALEKQILFRVDREAGLPEAIDTDGQRLSQILKNLLSNAIKFTERGTVSLEIRPQGNNVEIAVRDTGIGIAQEHQAVIFEPFRQADGTTNRRFGGTGLGLSISRELARLLGGQITLESQPGEGSVFRLLVPVVPPAAAGTDQSAAAAPPRAPAAVPTVHPAPGTHGAMNGAMNGAHSRARPAPRSAALPDDRARLAQDGADDSRVLLVIEDDPLFARVLYDLAHELGFSCLVAGTADEGMELATQFRLAAVVLDIKLPDHSGLTVLDRLKHNPMTRHVPVQVISAEDNTRAARAMGAAGALIKPVDREALHATLLGLRERFASERRTVLVVEDNALQRESIVQLLASDTTRVHTADNAASALEQLRSTTFDCMVLDLTLPDATGYELLERMAADDGYAFPPVIVYTGRQIAPEEEQQLRKYSRSIIIKGAKSPERLLDEVTLFLHQVEGRLPPDRQRMLAEARKRDSAFEGRRILVVEDDVRNIFALSSVLEPLGGNIIIARNGREALNRLASKPAPDIVLMDIMMPEMDGIEAMQEIRKQPELRDLPMIALTAKAMPDDQQRCLAAGANDYITKPIDVDKLVSLIRIWMPQ